MRVRVWVRVDARDMNTTVETRERELVSHFISIRKFGAYRCRYGSANEPFAIDWFVMTANRTSARSQAKTARTFGIWRGYFQSKPPA